MKLCHLSTIGCCWEPATKFKNGFHLCQKHFEQGESLESRLNWLAQKLGERKKHGSWTPFYRLEDAGPWQEKAVREMEDADLRA